MRFWTALVPAVLATVVPAAAQGAAASVSALGYSTPTLITVAPGQIVTVFVSGINPNPSTGGTAGVLPLPTSLAGVTVSLTQGQSILPAPILRVLPAANYCPLDDSPGCSLTGVTVQIPVGLDYRGGEFNAFAMDAVLSVSDGTNTSIPMFLLPVGDQIHILGNDPTINSPPAITHLDGSLVSASNPAAAGEVLVLYGVGRGVPSSLAVSGASGQASPSPATTTCCLTMVYHYRQNASPAKAGSPSPSIEQDPTVLFEGFTPTLVGVFQVNFVPPAPPGPIPACDNVLVLSNLTVTVAGYSSFDGAGICVKSASQ